MNNKQLLKKIFKSNNIKSYADNKFICLNKNKVTIVIYTNTYYLQEEDSIKKTCIKRKNCWIEKSSFNLKKYIIFHEDYIKFILRQKTLNTLLND